MNRTLLTLLALAAFAAAASAVVIETDRQLEASPSPEPVDDPMMERALYVTPAMGGTGPRTMLGATATICPTDYPMGYTIECKTPSDRARFVLNGGWVRTEVARPYYIGGNTAEGKVAAWEPPASVGSGPATVACKSGGIRIRSEVTFGC